ncbi:MAG: replication initiator protein A [Pseudomonadota bacterium]
MVTETTNLSPLLPDRNTDQGDLFVCDVADAILKDIMQHMEHPFYSLSKKPETRVRRYEHNGNWLEITPSVKGLATIYDKDILIYCISVIMQALKDGKKVSQRVRINSHDLLQFTHRGTSGRDYMALAEALDRLAGTRISTNIRTGDEEQFDTFGLIDAASIRRKHGLDGRLLWCEVKISDWVFNAIEKQEVLTLHPDYFRLRKPLERRVYEIARKHCGHQENWKVGLPTLLKKSGSQSPMKRFKQMIKYLATHDHLPDYRVEFDRETDMVTFVNRGTMNGSTMLEAWNGHLDSEAHSDAKAVLQGWDSYHVEQEWREFLGKNEIEPKHPTRHFLKFCKSYVENRGAAR